MFEVSQYKRKKDMGGLSPALLVSHPELEFGP
jgi:hypothetical protein